MIEKKDLMTSRVAKGASTLGPHHDGGPKPGFYAKPGAPGLETHHTTSLTHGMRHVTPGGNLARDGAPKRHVSVPVHNGMTERQRTLSGMGHSNESAGLLDHVETNPMRPVAPGKRLADVKPTFSARSRNSDAMHSDTPGAAYARGTHPAHAAEIKILGQMVMREAMADDDMTKIARAVKGEC